MPAVPCSAEDCDEWFAVSKSKLAQEDEFYCSEHRDRDRVGGVTEDGRRNFTL
jgi:hypothetical protein